MQTPAGNSQPGPRRRPPLGRFRPRPSVCLFKNRLYNLPARGQCPNDRQSPGTGLYRGGLALHVADSSMKAQQAAGHELRDERRQPSAREWQNLSGGALAAGRPRRPLSLAEETPCAQETASGPMTGKSLGWWPPAPPAPGSSLQVKSAGATGPPALIRLLQGTGETGSHGSRGSVGSLMARQLLTQTTRSGRANECHCCYTARSFSISPDISESFRGGSGHPVCLNLPMPAPHAGPAPTAPVLLPLPGPQRWHRTKGLSH